MRKNFSSLWKIWSFRWKFDCFLRKILSLFQNWSFSKKISAPKKNDYILINYYKWDNLRTEFLRLLFGETLTRLKTWIWKFWADRLSLVPLIWVNFGRESSAKARIFDQIDFAGINRCPTILIVLFQSMLFTL